MSVSVLGISGSPRRNGNTEKLLDAFLKGAEDAGGDVEKIVLKKLRFRSCMGCNKCHNTGICVVKDDLTPVLEMIATTDVLALSSPIYSMGITSELKALIDRGQYLWARKFVLKDLEFSAEHIKLHKGLFISTAGQDTNDVFLGAYPVLTAFFNDFGIEYYDNIIVKGMDRWGGIDGHPDALKGAEEKGSEIVMLIEEMKEKEKKE
ncbi:MAG: flavodoxin family protein [Methanomicrobiaceae archaeon]|nr:flavodoxin family protein [Methanomicrobiaceae archaeon]